MRRVLLVLMVEDEPAIREVVGQFFAIDPHLTLVAVATLAEARMRLANGSKPDCIVLDLVLPDADGLTAINTLRQEAPDVPIVVFSGHDTLEADCLRAGADDFLAKPGSAHELIRMVRHAVIRRESRRLFSPAKKCIEAAQEKVGRVEQILGEQKGES